MRAELLHGAVSAKDFANITTMLEAFDEFNLAISDWQILGDNLYNLRKKGISIPFSDAIIATTAIKHGISVWTGDKHFLLIQSALTGLNIYQTPDRLLKCTHKTGHKVCVNHRKSQVIDSRFMGILNIRQ